MSLLSLVGNPPNNHKVCGFRGWVNGLPEAEQEAIEQLFDDTRWTTSALAREFIALGCPVGLQRIADHRNGDCVSCGPRK